MNRRTLLQGLLAGAGLTTLLGGCGRAEPGTEMTVLRLGTQLWPGNLPASIAAELGFMQARGLDLRIHNTEDTDTVMAGFAAGRYDLVTSTVGDAITLHHDHTDTVVFMVVDESQGGDVLLQAPGFVDDGVSALRVGTGLGGFGEVFLQAYLDHLGVSAMRVAWTDVPAADVPRALADHRIDLGHTWAPHDAVAVGLGAKPVYTSADTPGLVLDVMVGSRAAIRRDPAPYRAFAAAWWDAVAAWRADPGLGGRIAAARFGVEAASMSLGGLRLYGLDDNRRAMASGRDSPLAKLVDHYGRFQVERGAASHLPDPGALLDRTVLFPSGGTRP